MGDKTKMSDSEKDWKDIKKQIKKTIQQHQTIDNSSSKTTPPSWQDIEKHIRKKHTHSHKKTIPVNQSSTKTKKQDETGQENKKTSDRKSQPNPNTNKNITKKQESNESIKNTKPMKSISYFFHHPLKKRTNQKKQQGKHFLKPLIKTKKKSLFNNKKNRFTKSFKKNNYSHNQLTEKISQPLKKVISFRIRINKQKVSNLNFKQLIIDNIVELLLIIFGTSFIFTFTQANIKIGLTLILIASFLLLLMSDESKQTTHQQIKLQPLPKKQPIAHPASYYVKKHNTKTPPIQKQFYSITRPIKTFFQKDHLKKIISLKNIHLALNDRITITLISWTLLLFIITADIEIFFVLIFLGILITKEMTDVYTSKTFKTKLNAYIITFLIMYTALISQKIITILQT